MKDKGRLTAFISSTHLDNAERRKVVEDAVWRAGMVPVGAERFTASTAPTVDECQRQARECDVYIGIIAHRYGTIPKGHELSYTELEYDAAAAGSRPRFVFQLNPGSVNPDVDFDPGPDRWAKQEKLESFKAKLAEHQMPGHFEETTLGAMVLQALFDWRTDSEPATRASSIHRISTIPLKPAPYIAHPYTLLQVHGLIGRQSERTLLTDWVTRPDSEAGDARILCLVAIGGTGKSALAWDWFQNDAPNELPDLAGRAWWSFYESDAHFENFVTRTLAYVTGVPEGEVRAMSVPERETALLETLDAEPYLLVLDGLERELLAYARLDPAKLADEDLDDVTANQVAGTLGLPESTGQSFFRRHRLRRASHPRAGEFLRRLPRVRATRVLITTRLYPADLQNVAGNALPGCFAAFLGGLADDDAVRLWRAFKVKGSRELLLPMFNAVDNHPLVVQALAADVARYRSAPGDFVAWRVAHPGFDPSTDLPLAKRQTHVLAQALAGVDGEALTVLRTIAGFRMPAHGETLALLVVGESGCCADAGALDRALGDLEDRALVGWDRTANRYDLHPIVRQVVWHGVAADDRHTVYASLQGHFEDVPALDWKEVESVDDLTPAIELYHSLVGLGQLDAAFDVFVDRLEQATLYRLGTARLLVELLELLFPDGVEKAPRVRPSVRAYVLASLGQGYVNSGQPGRAMPLFERNLSLPEQIADWDSRGPNLRNLADAAYVVGRLRVATRAALRSVRIARRERCGFDERKTMRRLGHFLAARGENTAARIALHRSRTMPVERLLQHAKGRATAVLAEHAAWQGDGASAKHFAERAWALAESLRVEHDFTRAARMRGLAALLLDDDNNAREWLETALRRAQAIHHADDELPARVGLAHLALRQGDPHRAREWLEPLWEPATDGPYPMWHADAHNGLSDIERAEGSLSAAVEAATKAYTLAWCDGPPYAYHWGLQDAKRRLAALGAPEPEMPPFDESKFEPLPDVEINPEDEHWVDPDDLPDIES